jgi:hypothetical protein
MHQSTNYFDAQIGVRNMQPVSDLFSSAEFWKIALPALAAIVAWFFNERSKLSSTSEKKRATRSYCAVSVGSIC